MHYAGYMCNCDTSQWAMSNDFASSYGLCWQKLLFAIGTCLPCSATAMLWLLQCFPLHNFHCHFSHLTHLFMCISHSSSHIAFQPSSASCKWMYGFVVFVSSVFLLCFSCPHVLNVKSREYVLQVVMQYPYLKRPAGFETQTRERQRNQHSNKAFASSCWLSTSTDKVGERNYSIVTSCWWNIKGKLQAAMQSEIVQTTICIGFPPDIVKQHLMR